MSEATCRKKKNHEDQQCLQICQTTLKVTGFWFWTEHLWIILASFWLSTDEMNSKSYFNFPSSYLLVFTCNFRIWNEPILVTLNECFGESFVFWNTVANFGSTTGAFVMPVVVERSLEAYGFQGAFLIMGGLSLNAVVCGAAIGPEESHKKKSRSENGTLSQSKTAREAKRKEWTDSAGESEMSHCMSESHGHSTEERSLLLGGGGARTPGHDIESDPVPRSSGQGSSSSPFANILGRLKSTWLFHEPWSAFMLCPTFAFYYVYYAWLLFLIPNAEWLGIHHPGPFCSRPLSGVSAS